MECFGRTVQSNRFDQFVGPMIQKIEVAQFRETIYNVP